MVLNCTCSMVKTFPSVKMSAAALASVVYIFRYQLQRIRMRKCSITPKRRHMHNTQTIIIICLRRSSPTKLLSLEQTQHAPAVGVATLCNLCTITVHLLERHWHYVLFNLQQQIYSPAGTPAEKQQCQRSISRRTRSALFSSRNQHTDVRF